MVFKAPLNGAMRNVFNPPMMSDGGTPPLPVFSPEYQAVVDYAQANSIALPPVEEMVAADAFVSTLKSAGVFDTFDTAYLAAGSVKEFAFINIKDPSKHYVTENETPTFVPLVGFRGLGGSYRTNYSFALDAVNATLNSCTVAAYVSGNDFGISALGEIVYQEGSGGTIASLNTNSYPWPQYMSPRLFSTYDGAATGWAPSNPNTTGFGLRMVSRRDATTGISLFVGALPQTNYTATSVRHHVALPDENIPIMAGPGGNTGDGKLTVGFYSIGGDCHSGGATIQSAMLTYLNAIGGI